MRSVGDTVIPARPRGFVTKSFTELSSFLVTRIVRSPPMLVTVTGVLLGMVTFVIRFLLCSCGLVPRQGRALCSSPTGQTDVSASASCAGLGGVVRRYSFATHAGHEPTLGLTVPSCGLVGWAGTCQEVRHCEARDHNHSNDAYVIHGQPLRCSSPGWSGGWCTVHPEPGFRTSQGRSH